MEHPDSLALLAVALGDGDQADIEHADTCVACRAIVDTHRRDEDIAFERAIAAYRRTERLTLALALPAPEPSRAQLWRTEWDDVVQVIWIVSVDAAADTVLAAPVVEVETADDTSTHLPADVLGWEAAVVRSLALTLPTRVLDQFLGTATDPEPAPNRGPVDSPADERSHVHAVVHDRLNELTNATWIPADASDSSVADRMRDRWHLPSAASSALGIDPGAARELMRGTRPPSSVERDALAAAGIEGTTQPPPDALVWAVDRPQLRQLWKADAASHGTVDGPAYRWEAYTNQRFALAARKTGHQGDSRQTWLGIVKAALDVSP